MLVRCPRCHTMTEFSQKNKFRPFCSERCKLIDLGDWAEEKFRIPTENQNDDADLVTAQSTETEDPLKEEFED